MSARRHLRRAPPAQRERAAVPADGDRRRFQRQIALDEDIDVQGCKAGYRRGSWTITMPAAKKKPPEPMRVSIPIRKAK